MVNGSVFPSQLKNAIFPFIFFLILSESFLSGQEKTYNTFYRIYFRDKGENNVNDVYPSDLLSEKAIERRNKAGILVPDFRDIPVYSGYLDQVSSLCFKLHSASKWLNTALFKTETIAD